MNTSEAGKADFMRKIPLLNTHKLSGSSPLGPASQSPNANISIKRLGIPSTYNESFDSRQGAQEQTFFPNPHLKHQDGNNTYV